MVKLNSRFCAKRRVLRVAFTRKDPQSDKRQSSNQFLFSLWGSACIKAAHKTLVKLIPDLFFRGKVRSSRVHHRNFIIAVLTSRFYHRGFIIAATISIKKALMY